MRIGIDIRALNGPKYGGVAEYIKNLLPAMFEAAPEHEFHLFNNAFNKKNDSLSAFKKYSNVTVHNFSYPNKLLTFSCRYLKRPRPDKLMGGVDVFFAPHFFPAPVSRNCKKVIKFHDLSFERFGNFFDKRRRLWHKYVSPRAQARSASGIIAASYSTKDDIKDLYKISPDKIKVIYSGLNKTLLDNYNPRLNARYKWPRNYILSLSTIEPRKNIISLIRAFNVLKEGKEFQNIKLVVAGSYGWSYKKILKEAKKSRYNKDIIFTGSVPEGAKPYLYRNASLFIYPSLYEGFGFPPLEAMYCGTPAIVSLYSSLPEVTGGAALTADTTRPDEVASLAADVLRDDRLHKHLSTAGRVRAETFDWKLTAKGTLKVLENA